MHKNSEEIIQLGKAILFTNPTSMFDTRVQGIKDGFFWSFLRALKCFQSKAE